MQITMPIIEATKRAEQITEISLLILTLLLSPDARLIMQVVTDEKMIGIIEIEIKVKNTSPNGFAVSPNSGHVTQLTIAKKTERKVI
jgi:hypothetical protein